MLSLGGAAGEGLDVRACIPDFGLPGHKHDPSRNEITRRSMRHPAPSGKGMKIAFVWMPLAAGGSNAKVAERRQTIAHGFRACCPKASADDVDPVPPPGVPDFPVKPPGRGPGLQRIRAPLSLGNTPFNRGNGRKKSTKPRRGDRNKRYVLSPRPGLHGIAGVRFPRLETVGYCLTPLGAVECMAAWAIATRDRLKEPWPKLRLFVCPALC
jgi:hypothetical protein